MTSMCQKCQTLNTMPVLWYDRWESATCCGEDSVSTQSRLKRDRFQRNTYLLHAVVSSFPFWLNKRQEKKEHFPSADRAAVQKESSARLEYSSTSACSSRSAFKKRGDRTGWRARWNLRLTRDARRMYSTCRRCQTVKRLRDTPDPCVATSIASSYASVIQISLRTLWENRPSQCNCNRYHRLLLRSNCYLFPLPWLLKKYFS